jgi:hypothetical protein
MPTEIRHQQDLRYRKDEKRRDVVLRNPSAR